MEGTEGPGSQGFALPGVPCEYAVCACWGSAPVRLVGLPRGGAVSGPVFFLPLPSKSNVAVFLRFSAVTTGGGTRSLTRYQPRPGWRDWKGTEGEGRDYSSAGFRSRYRPFGATNAKTSTAGHLEIWSCFISAHQQGIVTYFDR